MRSIEVIFLTHMLVLLLVILLMAMPTTEVNLRPLAELLANRASLVHGMEMLDIGIPARVELYENATLEVIYHGSVYRAQLSPVSPYELKALRSADMGPVITIYGKLNGTQVIVWIGAKLEE